ncbi:hypothetical protein JD844_030889 [Phrynosoma platyrhinos]|uniref:Uncharacterized protein n=1 Tax=Phrynosoma platyrhinos TaxID=52577 RepID=A0ABQ7T017_PHRPL|nr:hypothetical protein JD844_030889 [Phrynosoma platyrhinos]
MKQAKEKVKKRHTPAPARPRKPDQQVYHPCRRSKVEASPGLEYEGSSESSSSTEPDVNSPALFCLEYEADSGEITSVVVHQLPFLLHWLFPKTHNDGYRSPTSEPRSWKVVEKVSAQNHLEPALREALRRRVQEELEKRRVKR